MGIAKIQGVCKNIFIPLLVGHENDKSLGFVRKNFPHRQATGLMHFCIGFENFCKIKKSAPRKERTKSDNIHTKIDFMTINLLKIQKKLTPIY